MKYIAIPAHTNSQWDTVDFALLDVDRLDKIERCIERAHELHKEGIVPTWDDDYVDFLCGDILSDVLEERSELVELSQDDIDAFAQPQQNLDGGGTKIDIGGVVFKAYGEHTGEEYWARLTFDDVKRIAKRLDFVNS